MSAPVLDPTGSQTVQIHLLGGVTAHRDDGAPLDVGPAKCQAVLATLALSPGQAVTVDRLVETVWGLQPPRTAAKTLQTYVTRLRRGLGEDVIERVGEAYRLNVPPGSIDVVRFREAATDDRPAVALTEWGGAPLAGLEGHGLGATVDSLVEQWLGVVEADLALRIADEPAAAVARLTELTTEHPFREGLWELLMRALYGAGRQADALAAYRSARSHLVEQLGVEPGPRLQELEAQILGHDRRLNVGATVTGRGAPSGTVTFAFADFGHSAADWATDPVAATTAVDRREQTVRELAADHDGVVFASAHGSAGVAFHRASDALAWAAALAGGADATAAATIAVHTGEPEQRGATYFGEPVMTAARLAAVGHPGQVLVSGATAGVAGRHDLRPLGSVRLDGLVGEQQVLQVGSDPHPPLRTGRDRRAHLPLRPDRLIGRTAAVESVAAALADTAVVTLVGPGGIGKTRLALAAADAVADRFDVAHWVELAQCTESADVPEVVARSVDATTRVGASPTDAVVAALADRRALLVLDNCEHVLSGAASLAAAIGRSAGDTVVLATSREGLGVSGERLVAVAPLPVDDAVALFVERATAVSPTFDPVAQTEAVTEICRRVDGLPLAVELAAARTVTRQPTDLVDRLDQHLRLLTGGRRGGVERHRTLRATVQWSYDLLTEVERTVFDHLSVFIGLFDRSAAAEVVGAGLDADTVDDALDGLVEQSMVQVEPSPFGQRFRLLETLRQFGAERLAEAGTTDVVAAAHVGWCLERVRHVHRLVAGPDEVEGVLRLDELWSNLRAAVSWAADRGDVALLRSLIEPVAAEVYLRNRIEIGEWAERLLVIADPADDDTRVFAMRWATRRCMVTQDLGGYERLVDRWGRPADPMNDYGRAFLYGNHVEQRRLAPRALAQLREEGEHYLAELFEVVGVGITLLLANELTDHDAHVAPLVERYRRVGPPTALNWALTFLGISASVQGRHDEAWERFGEAAEVALPPGTRCWNVAVEARQAFLAGDHRQAFERLGDHFDQLAAASDHYTARLTALDLADMLFAVGRRTEAAEVVRHLDATGMLASANFAATAAPMVAALQPELAALADTPTPDDTEMLTRMRQICRR